MKFYRHHCVKLAYESLVNICDIIFSRCTVVDLQPVCYEPNTKYSMIFLKVLICSVSGLYGQTKSGAKINLKNYFIYSLTFILL